MIDIVQNPIFLASIGGLLVNILNLVELQNIPKERRPNFQDIIYWIPYLVWPITGAILVIAYQASGYDVKGVLALNIGLSAPLIIKSMATSKFKEPEKIDLEDGA